MVYKKSDVRVQKNNRICREGCICTANARRLPNSVINRAPVPTKKNKKERARLAPFARMHEKKKKKIFVGPKGETSPRKGGDIRETVSVPIGPLLIFKSWGPLPFLTIPSSHVVVDLALLS